MDAPLPPAGPSPDAPALPAPPLVRRVWSLVVTGFVNRRERRPRAGWRLATQLLLLLLVSWLAGLGVGLVAWLVDWISPGIRNALPQGAAWYAGLGISCGVITFSVWTARRWVDRRSFSTLGLTLDRRVLPDIAFGFAVSAVMEATIFATHLAAGWIVAPRFAWETLSPGAVVSSFAALTVAFALVGWYEELLLRGYWLQNLADGLGLVPAVILSSVVFSAGHRANPHIGWIPLLGLVCAGIFLALAYVWTGRLWLAIGLHWGWNLFEGPVFGLPVSGLDLPALIQYSVEGPELLTGGAFGPEAGLVQFPALALGVLLVILYARRQRGAGAGTAAKPANGGSLPAPPTSV